MHKTWVRLGIATRLLWLFGGIRDPTTHRKISIFVCKVCCEGHKKIWHFRVKELSFYFVFNVCPSEKCFCKNSSEIENLSILFGSIVSSRRAYVISWELTEFFFCLSISRYIRLQYIDHIICLTHPNEPQHLILNGRSLYIFLSEFEYYMGTRKSRFRYSDLGPM